MIGDPGWKPNLDDLYLEIGWPERLGAPTPETRALVMRRSNAYCEWIGCRAVGTDVHHRLNRKAGGRSGLSSLRVNSPAYLLVACRYHHQMVTSQHGVSLQLARETGWLLREHEDGTQVAVLTRHRPEPVLLKDNGSWYPTTLPREWRGLDV